MLWRENLDTRLNTQAQAKHSNTAHANLCQASLILQTYSSGPLLLPPIFANIKTTSETPSVHNSTVLLTVKHCYSMQLFTSLSEKESFTFCSTQTWKNEELCPCNIPGCFALTNRITFSILYCQKKVKYKSDWLISVVFQNNTHNLFYTFYIVTSYSIIAIILQTIQVAWVQK